MKVTVAGPNAVQGEIVMQPDRMVITPKFYTTQRTQELVRITVTGAKGCELHYNVKISERTGKPVLTEVGQQPKLKAIKPTFDTLSPENKPPQPADKPLVGQNASDPDVLAGAGK